MNDQRMVDVGLLEELEWHSVIYVASEEQNLHACPSCGELERDGHAADCKLRAIIDGPGVEPAGMVVLKGFKFSGEPIYEVMDSPELRKQEGIDKYGVRFYLAAPSAPVAPVQAVPDGWQLVPKEPTTDDRKDAERYRWLRHGDNDEYVLRTHFSAHDGEETTWLLRNAELDAAIDAAIASEKENERG